jgi:hypothetical protein
MDKVGIVHIHHYCKDQEAFVITRIYSCAKAIAEDALTVSELMAVYALTNRVDLQ